MNPCGDCKFCCEHMKIPKQDMPLYVEKPAGVLCPYYNNGCSIHESKPLACKIYKCYWLELFEEGLVDSTEWRPNEVGFCVSRRKDFMFLDGEVEKEHPLLNYIRERDGDVKFVQR